MVSAGFSRARGFRRLNSTARSDVAICVPIAYGPRRRHFAAVAQSQPGACGSVNVLASLVREPGVTRVALISNVVCRRLRSIPTTATPSCLGAFFGPSLSSRADVTSVDMAVQFLNGSFRTGVLFLPLGLVDVRDVALAHTRAALSPHAHGRYSRESGRFDPSLPLAFRIARYLKVHIEDVFEDA
jgi:hypothetical protein